MAIPVYSTRFINAHAVSSLQTYTVPSGYLAVVRQFSFTLPNSSSVFSYYAYIAGGARIVFGAANPPNYVSESYEGRWIALAGETITMGMTGITSYDVYAGGYLLALP